MVMLQRVENFITSYKFALFSFIDGAGESDIFKCFFEHLAHEVLPLLQDFYNGGLQRFSQFGFIDQCG